LVGSVQFKLEGLFSINTCYSRHQAKAVTCHVEAAIGMNTWQQSNRVAICFAVGGCPSPAAVWLTLIAQVG
jgi:hypothetical protein